MALQTFQKMTPIHTKQIDPTNPWCMQTQPLPGLRIPCLPRLRNPSPKKKMSKKHAQEERHCSLGKRRILSRFHPPCEWQTNCCCLLTYLYSSFCRLSLWITLQRCCNQSNYCRSQWGERAEGKFAIHGWSSISCLPHLFVHDKMPSVLLCLFINHNRQRKSQLKRKGL